MRAIKIDPDMITVVAVELTRDEHDPRFVRYIQGKFKPLPAGDGHLILVSKGHANMEVPNFKFRNLPAISGTALIVARDVVGFTDAEWTAEQVAADVVWNEGATHG